MKDDGSPETPDDILELAGKAEAAAERGEDPFAAAGVRPEGEGESRPRRAEPTPKADAGAPEELTADELAEAQRIMRGEADPEAPPADEPTYLLDGQKLTATEIRELIKLKSRAGELSTLGEEKIRFEERKRLADQQFQEVLKDPAKYEQARKALGLASEPQNNEIDPIADPFKWRYARANQLRGYYKQQGQEVDERALQSQVEIDLQSFQVDARMKRLEKLQTAIEGREREAEAAAGAREIERRLEPLYKRYKYADNEEGREEVENALIAAAHLGRTVNYEDVVKKVAEKQLRVLKSYVTKKRDMAQGTRPVSRPGASRAPTGPADKLKGHMSDFDDLADMLSKQGNQ